MPEVTVAIVDDLTALAARYHQDKLAHTLNYPKEFVAGPGVTRDAFDYFPEHHYRQGFEALRGQVSDTTLDEWMDEILHHRPVGAEHGGLWRDNIPQLVADILSSSQRYETEITIRPENMGEASDYTVEWAYVDWDRDIGGWKPVKELDTGDPGST